MIRRYKGSELYRIFRTNKQDFIEHFKYPMEIVTDDGDVVSTSGRAMLLSFFLFQITDEYPIKFTKEHCVETHMKDGFFTAGICGDVLCDMLFEVYDQYKDAWVEEAIRSDAFVNPHEIIRFKIDNLCRRSLEVYNEAYNIFVQSSLDYMTTIDVMDIINITLDPTVIEARSKIVDNEQSIREFDKVVENLIMKSEKYRHSTLTTFVKCKVIKMLQVLQMIASRGFLTDIGSGIFSRAIKNSYAIGLNDMYEFAIDSRSAGKALAFAEQPLEDGSYGHRKMRLASGYFQNIHMGDCGSTHYINWPVGPNDYYAVIGMRYLDPRTGVEKTITKRNVKDLIGQSILVRNILRGCMHEDPQGTCEACFGEQTLATHFTGVPGVLVISREFRDIIQGMLSIKHLDGTAALKEIVLKHHALKNMQVRNHRFLHFNPAERARFKEFGVIINTDNIKSFDRLHSIDIGGFDSQRLDDLSSLSKGIEIAKISFNEGGKSEYIESVSMKYNGKIAALSKEFLNYMKHVGYKPMSRNKVLVNLNQWDCDQPFAALPFQHYTLTAFQREFSGTLESPRDYQGAGSIGDPVQLLKELHRQITQLNDPRFRITLPTLQAMIYPLCARDPDNGDYRLPKGDEAVVLSLSDSMTLSRSASAIIAYQELRAPLTSVRGIWDGSSESQKYRPLVHQLDGLIA